jgi:hypothetical protein
MMFVYIKLFFFSVQMAQRGQITEKVSEGKLISLLNQISEQDQKKPTKITVKNKSNCEANNIYFFFKKKFLLFVCIVSTEEICWR